MTTINKNTLTRKQIEKAMACKTAEELMALAKAEGHELTKDEAEAYLAELADLELDDKELKEAAGGICWTDCPEKGEKTHYCAQYKTKCIP